MGNFSCNGNPESNVTVKLYQKNTNLTDKEKLNETYTNENGSFNIYGEWKNYTLFSNYMSFTHKCNVSDKAKCNRTFSFPFPLYYVKNTSAEAINGSYTVNININSTSEKSTFFGNETCVNVTTNESPSVQ
uniref:Membrane glycoprotein n=1 Tax=Strongyloides venezuelensis TaxID=75913 RepID=A0A0K0FNP7_STRVS